MIFGTAWTQVLFKILLSDFSACICRSLAASRVCSSICRRCFRAFFRNRYFGLGFFRNFCRSFRCRLLYGSIGIFGAVCAGIFGVIIAVIIIVIIMIRVVTGTILSRDLVYIKIFCYSIAAGSSQKAGLCTDRCFLYSRRHLEICIGKICVNPLHDISPESLLVSTVSSLGSTVLSS